MRTVYVVVALGSALVLSTACNPLGQTHEITMELTGDGSVSSVAYKIPGSRSTTENDVTLPWKKSFTTEFGRHEISATPTKGTVMCRIIADGKEIEKVEGQPGKPVQCSKIVNDR